MQSNVAPPVQEMPHVNKKGPGSILLRLVTCLILMTTAGVGVYFWQQNEAEQKEQNLQAEINKLASEAAQPKLNYYKSKTGGLTLDLPPEYAVIVNVDGNKGGAPGATLRVAQIEDGVVFDNVYAWLEIEVDHFGGTLEANTLNVKQELERDGLENVKVTDSRFKQQPAKVLTAEGFSYNASRRVYVVQNGEFLYRFISKTGDNSKNNALLQAVLDGSTIEVKSLR